MKRLARLAATVAALCVGWTIGMLLVLAWLFLVSLIFLAYLEHPEIGFASLAILIALGVAIPWGKIKWLKEVINCVKISWSVFWQGGAVETVAKGASYSLVDNLTTAISPATVAFLKAFGWEDIWIVGVMWVEDIIIAYCTMRFSQEVVEDFTLSKALRAAVESIRDRSTIGCVLSWMLKIGLVIRFALWDGPERVAIFFHKELKTHVQELLVIVVFAAVQAIFWTKMYSLGIDGLVDIWKLLF
jgi:hypothetical protein